MGHISCGLLSHLPDGLGIGVIWAFRNFEGHSDSKGKM